MKRRTRRVMVVVAFTFLLILPNVRLAATQTPPSGWMSQTQAQEFGQSLITDYTNLLGAKIKFDSNFSTVVPYLSLYHGPNDNFKVVVTRWALNDSKHMTVYFFPITGNQTRVTIDETGTTKDYAGSAFFGYAKDITFVNASGTTQLAYLVYGGNASLITGNPYEGAQTVATSLLNVDEQMWAQANPPPPWYEQLWAEILYVLGAVVIFLYLYEFFTGHINWPLRKGNPRIRHPRKSNPIVKPPLDYQINALNQILGNWIDSTHKREITLKELANILPIMNRDGINPIFEPLSIDLVGDAIDELKRRGTIKEIRNGTLFF